MKRKAVLISLSASLLALSACGTDIKSEAKYPTGLERTQTGDDIYGEKESVFGDSNLKLFGDKDKNNNKSGDNGIDVNSFLWRASLDTVSFMPLASADPFGGVILTDWYAPAESADERVKLNVFILGRELRSDGVRVRVFKQTKQGTNWVDSEAAPETGRQLEDAILTRARQLRVSQLAEK